MSYNNGGEYHRQFSRPQTYDPDLHKRTLASDKEEELLEFSRRKKQERMVADLGFEESDIVHDDDDEERVRPAAPSSAAPVIDPKYSPSAFAALEDELARMQKRYQDAREELHGMTERERKASNSLSKLQIMSKSQTAILRSSFASKVESRDHLAKELLTQLKRHEQRLTAAGLPLPPAEAQADTFSDVLEGLEKGSKKVVSGASSAGGGGGAGEEELSALRQESSALRQQLEQAQQEAQEARSLGHKLDTQLQLLASKSSSGGGGGDAPKQQSEQQQQQQEQELELAALSEMVENLTAEKAALMELLQEAQKEMVEKTERGRREDSKKSSKNSSSSSSGGGAADPAELAELRTALEEAEALALEAAQRNEELEEEAVAVQKKMSKLEASNSKLKKAAAAAASSSSSSNGDSSSSSSSKELAAAVQRAEEAEAALEEAEAAAAEGTRKAEAAEAAATTAAAGGAKSLKGVEKELKQQQQKMKQQLQEAEEKLKAAVSAVKAEEEARVEAMVEEMAKELEQSEANAAAKEKELRAAVAAATASGGAAKEGILNLQKQMKADRQAMAQLRKETKRELKQMPLLLEDVQKQLVARCTEAQASLQEVVVKYRKEQAERKRLFNLVQELRGNIRVYCRSRPASASELKAGHAVAVDFRTEDAIAVTNERNKKKAWDFDKVFPPSTTQAQVFAETEGLIVSCMDGYNVCIFAYGQTGSGKTHTMTGPSEDRGVNHRALHHLFAQREQRSGEFTDTINVSLLEIYNETIRDLLAEDVGSKKLEVKRGPQGNYVPELTMVPVEGQEEVVALMEMGEQNRSQSATDMNAHSSRSHSILSVYVESRNNLTGVVSRGKLHLVDLAGSERINKSGATGLRLKEAQNINKSLSALGDVIQARAQKNGHVPFRNSCLTYLLQDSLSKDSKTLMFVCVSPVVFNADETFCSLNFASRVRSVELGQATKHVGGSSDSDSGNRPPPAPGRKTK